MSDIATFYVGDRVVYPAHGVGQIMGEESQLIGGLEISVFVISFVKEKMTLRIPVKRAAATGLRQLSSDNEVQKVMSILQGKPKSSKGMWSRRAQEYEGKINSGDITSIAEVVRDLHKNVDDPERSYSERVIYESAFNRLASELAAVGNIESASASERISEILKDKYAA
ncbi:RNA polymerase-binding transcription factor CarD [Candidatus Arcanobacter lacustris]|jgi:CarD family transcriptional regulator|uniref:RNA polymerase-binding transcription factor CarD n=1 Tax=Candidatus Arcanibacter lacustris TaxID=1607817 RepID=A0A0F5MRG4_9RICK|nr:RNA polymerase-binding transcription factor CarD [Candidatus Arcanobacter lacustris]